MISRRAWWVGTLGSCLVLSLAACADDAKDEGALLVGRTFLLERADGYEPVPDTAVSLTFTAEELKFNAGCNQHVAPYSVQGGRLTVSGMELTQAYCNAPLMAQEAWIADFVRSEPGLAIDGDRLTLTGTDATLVFLDREVADPDRPLTGRTWAIWSLLHPDGSMSGGFGGSAATVVFQPDGTMQVVSYCAEGTGQYTAAGATLTFTNVVYQSGACSVAGLEDADAHTRAVLRDGTVSYDIEAAALTIRHGELGIRAGTE